MLLSHFTLRAPSVVSFAHMSCRVDSLLCWQTHQNATLGTGQCLLVQADLADLALTSMSINAPLDSPLVW